MSASQALQKLTSSRFRTISTGLDQLDAVLQGHDADSTNPPAAAGGLSRGEVAEVYGPPGVGKTHLLMQASAGALHAGDSVIWIGQWSTIQSSVHVSDYILLDTSHQLVRSRFIEMISSFRLPENHEPPSSPPTTRSMPELLDNFHHFTAPTLPHLLALIAHPSLSFPPEKTSLIVVDSISAIFATAFPRVIENYDGNQGSAKKNDILQWAASRRWSVMGDLISRMGKLAAIKNLAICLISQTTTKIRPETGAVIRPAISGKAWDDGIASRILILRDWSRAIEDSLSRGEQLHGIRFAGVIKAGGISYSGMGKVVIFTIGRVDEVSQA